MQFIRSLFGNPHEYNHTVSNQQLYPLENQSFESFDVIFKNTSDVLIKNLHIDTSDNVERYIPSTHKTVDNEPHILTMIVHSIPTIDADVHFDKDNKCVRISIKPDLFVQEKGRAYKVYNETTKMIDTTKYNCFSIDDFR